MTARRRLVTAALASVFAILAAIAVLRPGARSGGAAPAASSAPAAGPRPATSANLELLAPLSIGSDVGGYTIQEIVVERGALRVVCAKSEAVVALDVTAVSDKGPPPPAYTEKYAVFYSVRRGPAEAPDRLARALARVIAKNDGAPPPPWLETFQPVPIDL